MTCQVVTVHIFLHLHYHSGFEIYILYCCVHYFPILGITRSHTDFYLKCRSPCINDAAVKTNSLIIRLDKLISQCPSDSSKRKGWHNNVLEFKIL